MQMLAVHTLPTKLPLNYHTITSSAVWLEGLAEHFGLQILEFTHCVEALP